MAFFIKNFCTKKRCLVLFATLIPLKCCNTFVLCENNGKSKIFKKLGKSGKEILTEDWEKKVYSKSEGKLKK